MAQKRQEAKKALIPAGQEALVVPAGVRLAAVLVSPVPIVMAVLAVLTVATEQE